MGTEQNQEWPRESIVDFRHRKLKEMDETAERLEWEMRRALDNYIKFRQEMERELDRMEGQHE